MELPRIIRGRALSGVVPLYMRPIFVLDKYDVVVGYVTDNDEYPFEKIGNRYVVTPDIVLSYNHIDESVKIGKRTTDFSNSPCEPPIDVDKLEKGHWFLTDLDNAMEDEHSYFTSRRSVCTHYVAGDRVHSIMREVDALSSILARFMDKVEGGHQLRDIWPLITGAVSTLHT